MPRFGCFVVNGKSAISGRACESRERSVDFPAFGKPTSPASAIIFSSRVIQRSSPGVPGCVARGPVGRRRERLVAAPAPAPLADDDLIPRLGEIAERVAPVAVVDHGPRRNGDDQFLAALAVAIRGAARFAALGLPELAIDDLGEAVGPGDRAEDDVAAVAAVAAVGAAFGDVLLAPEAGHRRDRRRRPSRRWSLDRRTWERWLWTVDRTSNGHCIGDAATVAIAWPTAKS